jgi:hypothetical protein
MTKFLGREESIGFGIQTTTAPVAAQVWPRHLKNGLRSVVTKKKNTSALGRPEMNNGSAVMNRTSTGPIEMKLQDRTIGYLLYALMGGVTTTANPDASGLVKNHSFPVVPGADIYLTTVVKNLVDDRRYASEAVSAIEITSDAGADGDWVMMAVDLSGGDYTTGVANTPAYTDEFEFTQAHVSSKIAANLAGIGAATALETKNLKIRIQRNRTPFIPHGTKTAVAQDIEPLLVTGELTLRYKLADLEALWYNNTTRAMVIKIENTDATIGTAARPGLTFTMPQVTLETFDRTDDLDTYVEQTVAFDAELSLTDGYAVMPLLTNLQTAYAAA